jgi:hypothetical protein
MKIIGFLVVPPTATLPVACISRLVTTAERNTLHDVGLPTSEAQHRVSCKGGTSPARGQYPLIEAATQMRHDGLLLYPVVWPALISGVVHCLPPSFSMKHEQCVSIAFIPMTLEAEYNANIRGQPCLDISHV